MKFTQLEIPGLVLCEPDVWKDERGFFKETFHAKKYAESGIRKPFVQDNHSHSLKGVLRGLHYQKNHPQGKLVTAIRGEIYDVAVDLRRGSPAFGKSYGVLLTGENHKQLYVPEGCIHGFVVLSECADVLYKCTEIYVPSDDRGFIWNDPAFKIDWPLKEVSLSPKDAKLPRLADVAKSELPLYAAEIRDARSMLSGSNPL